MSYEIYDDRNCFLGEGALWHPERGQLFWFDILAGRLLSRDASGPREWNIGQMASAAGWVDADTLVISTDTGLRRFDIASGAHEPLVAIEADRDDTRCNDGRADPMGGFWASTMGRHAETGAGAIYRYFEGTAERLFPEISIPNSICFAPDGRRAYFSDTPKGKIMTVALDAQGWPEGAPEIFVDLSADGLNPDGGLTDAEGALWSAQWGSGRVARYLPDGRFDRAIEVGGRHSSCPAFGGPEFKTLFVTTAKEGIEEPDAAQGRVYCAPAGVAGRPEPAVRLPG
ncbi:SMP-30/gluconolactonase/LRE family protein [Thioclava nitratireducens]|uniref:SMP-30/gluconolactonase/LRE family protein n=1 Tax=Thioclava nitratireducens TaxID=1915078 RepID=UPI0024809D60|nr:SMP-30/gluconolactonase/LRE family protein [Thioclava nitratireducens]WGT51227.1 SMP-30/gluconolactonase/LRE family protein [Thioclava nitratireducens]